MAPRLHRKTKLDPYLDQLGVLPDAELAALVGVTAENVRAYRTRRGIPARWRGEGGPEDVADVSEVVPPKKPSGGRAKRKAAAALPPEPADSNGDLAVTDAIPEADSVADFGTAVDVDDVVDAPTEPITPPARPETRKRAPAQGPRSRRTKLGKYLEQLGVLPDAEIAAMAGVTAENVRTYRKRRGIPAGWRGESQREALAKGSDGRRGKLAAYQEQIGILTDARIAELAGTSPANVRAWRLRHGVPARWRGEGSPLPNEEAIRLLDAGRTAAAVESPALTIAASSPAPIRSAPAAPAFAGDLDGYEVTIEPGVTWLVVARDVAEAARKAMDAFAQRGVEGRVLNLRFVARLLEG
ncbi:MAG: hypothetical protein ABIO70_19585 [Pseudomonadota bacterium]